MLWLDEYERAARLAPGLLALLPIPILIAAFGVKHNPTVAAAVSLIVAAGGPLLVAKYVRARGKALETRLFTEWGGAPTTLLLLPSDAGDPVRTRRRANLEAVSGMALPTSWTEETAQICGDAVTVLRQRTYDHGTFPLVFAENKNYGFERNALAVRPEALGLSVAGLLIAGAGWAASASHHIHANVSAVAVGSIVILALLVFWLTWPTTKRVRAASDLYAAQLLDAAATLLT